MQPDNLRIAPYMYLIFYWSQTLSLQCFIAVYITCILLLIFISIYLMCI